MGAVIGPALAAAKVIGVGAKAVGTFASAHPFLTAGAAGAASAGAQAVSNIKAANVQKQAQEQANKQNQQMAALQAQQLQQAQQMAESQSKAITDSLQSRRDAFAALTKPAVTPDTSPLKGLGTIATSPLGDTSTPNIGRKKLLGN